VVENTYGQLADLTGSTVWWMSQVSPVSLVFQFVCVSRGQERGGRYGELGSVGGAAGTA
jgi:hypothetical protein